MNILKIIEIDIGIKSVVFIEINNDKIIIINKKGYIEYYQIQNNNIEFLKSFNFDIEISCCAY
tara:strand:- start:40 stop:228 length:189 start_codon:yes stop_codon:yes gene_type:complete